jgi:hypothetical protein
VTVGIIDDDPETLVLDEIDAEFCGLCDSEGLSDADAEPCGDCETVAEGELDEEFKLVGVNGTKGIWLDETVTDCVRASEAEGYEYVDVGLDVGVDDKHKVEVEDPERLGEADAEPCIEAVASILGETDTESCIEAVASILGETDAEPSGDCEIVATGEADAEPCIEAVASILGEPDNEGERDSIEEKEANPVSDT